MIYSDLILFTIGEYIGNLEEASFDKYALKGALSSLTKKTIKYKAVTCSNTIFTPFEQISKWMNVALNLKYNLYIRQYLDLYIFNWAMNASDYKIYKSIEPFTKKCDKKFKEKIICYRAFASSYYYYRQFNLKCEWPGHFVQLCKEVIQYDMKELLGNIVRLWSAHSKIFKTGTIIQFLKYAVQSDQSHLIPKILTKIDFKSIFRFEFERLIFECLKYNLQSSYLYCIIQLTKSQPELTKSVNTYSQLYQILKKKRVKINE